MSSINESFSNIELHGLEGGLKGVKGILGGNPANTRSNYPAMLDVALGSICTSNSIPMTWEVFKSFLIS